MRLIDADALRKAFKNHSLCNDVWLHYSREIIDNGPTVVRTERPCVIINDMAVYITQGHIDAMIEYEKREQVKEIVDSMMQSFDSLQSVGGYTDEN